MISFPNPAGVCPQCRGQLIRTKDNVGRRWLKCTSCGAQFPEDWGRYPQPPEDDGYYSSPE
jgi:hypothetical protein